MRRFLLLLSVLACRGEPSGLPANRTVQAAGLGDFPVYAKVGFTTAPANAEAAFVNALTAAGFEIGTYQFVDTRVGEPPSGPPPPPPPSGQQALLDMGALYGTSNDPPACLDVPMITPIDGVIGVASAGMSNAWRKWRTFRSDYADRFAPNVVFIDGAYKGLVAYSWARGTRPWDRLRNELSAAGIRHDQIRVVWMEHANPARTRPLEEYADSLRIDIEATIDHLADSLPNLQVILLSNRSYGGYATVDLNPEPYAYEAGKVVRDVILSRACRPGPVVVWGPDLWANGARPRTTDGLVWLRDDFTADGTHPSGSGTAKAAALIYAALEDIL